MKLYRWRPSTGENLGDWLSVPILRALGYTPEPPQPGEPCLFAVGTILHPVHYEAARAERVVVWGSGATPLFPPGVELDVRAVRGPISRALLGLPDDVPTGDPALLLPQLVNLPAPPATGEVLYVNHITPPAGELPGAVAVSAHVTAEAALPLVARIAAAQFVASESLHGCLLAAAYGVPWSFCSSRWSARPINWTGKHNDWLCYLGVPPIRSVPGSLAEARAWWERTGRHARLPPTDRLLGAFPDNLTTRGRWLRSVPHPTGAAAVKAHIDEGVLIEPSTVHLIKWQVSDKDGHWLPWVQIERSNGLGEIHVHCDLAATQAQAERVAKQRADAMIAKVLAALKS